MNREDIYDEGHRVGGLFALLREPLTTPPSDWPPHNHEADFKSVALSEGWHELPREVTRIRLRPWQQAVFWGLRIYIVVMLVVMVIGFARVAAGS